MSNKEIIKSCLIGILIALIITAIYIFVDKQNIKKDKLELHKNTVKVIPSEYKKMSFIILNNDGSEVFNEAVYDGLTLYELTEKLNRSLNSSLTNTGSIFASKCIELNIDPYLAVAIVLYETGCKWNCSSLVKDCNNIGGLKGTPSCGSGSYAYYKSLEEGIDFYLDYLSKKYYALGLTTPELMERKYTGGSSTWAIKVNSYINSIKAA